MTVDLAAGRVTMTIEIFPRERLPEPTREKLNPVLEAWYNRGAPELPTFEPRHVLFDRRDFDFPVPDAREDVDFDKLELLRHLTCKDLSEVAASDVTDGKRMHGTNLLCLCHSKYASWLPGRRIY